MNTQHIHWVLEAALLSAPEPLGTSALLKLFNNALTTKELELALTALQAQWTEKSVELVRISTGWRFQTKPQFKEYLDRLNPEKPPRYARSVLETLAIIAYKQPVTRGDIESVRGVTVASDVVKRLEDRGWIEVIGHRDAPGRPALFATTQQFLDDLSLRALSDLPPLTIPEGSTDLLNAAQAPIAFDNSAHSTASTDAEFSNGIPKQHSLTAIAT